MPALLTSHSLVADPAGDILSIDEFARAAEPPGLPGDACVAGETFHGTTALTRGLT